MPKVFKERSQSHNNFIYDYCDGEFFKEHPLFSVNKHALQLIVYYDEVETANPLGSYRGQHKLGLPLISKKMLMTIVLHRDVLLLSWQY